MTGRGVKHRRIVAALAASVALLPLAACGGGGGDGVQPIPSPPPPPSPPAPSPPPPTTPPPVPPPPPPPPMPLGTEAENSTGPAFHNAQPLYTGGIDGSGVIAAIIDSGIDIDSHEFTGRIDPRSTDITGDGRGIDDISGHGTRVARVLAAAKDNRDVHGIAFGATLLALRSDTPGSCTSAGDSCDYNSTNIAAAIDAAVDAGARVINISLSGNALGDNVATAIDNATQAGVIVVVPAGNNGSSQPRGFARDAVGAGNGAVIIATSVDDQGRLSDFSNEAGSFAEATLSALGEAICCVYENDMIEVSNNGAITLYSGTSFAVPQIAGAAALLAEAFPNLTGQQIVELLLDNARDAGIAGPDDIYGSGILDIGAAFAPSGQLNPAGLELTGGAGFIAELSPVMGDAAGDASLYAVALDRYDRAYEVPVAGFMRAAPNSQALARTLLDRSRHAALSTGPIQFDYAFRDDRPLAGDDWPGFADGLHSTGPTSARLTAAVNDRLSMTASLRQSGEGGPSWAAAETLALSTGRERLSPDRQFGLQPLSALGVSHAIGDWRIGGFGEWGYLRGALPLRAPDPAPTFDDHPYRKFGLVLESAPTPLSFRTTVTLVEEDSSLLGAIFDPALGNLQTRSLFVGGEAQYRIDGGWSLTFAGQQGWSNASGNGGLTGTGSAIVTRAFRLQLAKSGLFDGGDSLLIGIAQPLRVESGAVQVTLPVGYDYGSRRTTLAPRNFNLMPSGREITGELGYRLNRQSWNLLGNIYVRHQPDHHRDAPADLGVALRFTTDF